jgi:hypothetical protein
MTVGCGICHIDTKHVYTTNKMLRAAEVGSRRLTDCEQESNFKVC